ncbi:sugar ABC transporter substrate-binding protein [Nakamurella silvestris]|nr:sugar ABC transporter substrate-binding protein [Nakamurella silvestris]
MTLRSSTRLVAVGLVATLLAACGGSDKTADPTSTPPSTPAPSSSAEVTPGPDTSAGTSEAQTSADPGSSSAAQSSSPAEAEQGVDDGTALTLWTRAPLEGQANLLVDAYNASHKNQVALTIVPNDDYVAKVGAAAGSNGLPDLFAADIVYVPNWTSQGLFADITDRIAGLPFADQIAKGHVDAGTFDNKKFVLPFVLDLSVLFYNKALYKEAGLDPEKAPTTMAEFADHARKVDALNKDGVSGTFFGGNCGGCLVFTWFPSLWASGDQVMNPEGTEALLAGENAKKLYSIYHDLYADGITGEGTKDETGATWVAPFQEGKVGVMPMPATLLKATTDAGIDVGVAPIPGIDGGGSTFVGGDGIGISRDSKVSDQAWNFLAWTMSEDAQVEVLAKNNNVVARADLANNKYAAADPRLVAINEVAGQGVTPMSKNFQAGFNASDSPWLELVRNAVFGDASSIDADNDGITDVLSE